MQIKKASKKFLKVEKLFFKMYFHNNNFKKNLKVC